MKATQRVINGSKVARYLAPVTDAAGESSAAAAYLARYFEALPIGKGLPATELQPADDFALLACQALVAAWDHSSKPSSGPLTWSGPRRLIRPRLQRTVPI